MALRLSFRQPAPGDRRLAKPNYAFAKRQRELAKKQKKGEKLKRIGTEARTELERLIGTKVFLELWVKVRSGWADDDARLRTYGYE